MIGLKAPIKGKSITAMKTCSVEVDDDLPSLSELDDEDSHNDLEKSNASGDDGGNDDDEDFDVVKITNREARQMFDDEVSSLIQFVFDLMYILYSRCPRALWMHPRCLKMITTLKLPVPDPITASKIPARKPCDL